MRSLQQSNHCRGNILDFNVNNRWVFSVGGVEVWITDTIVNTWIIGLVLIGAAVVVRLRLRRFEEVPKGIQNAAEAVVELFDNFLVSSAGEGLRLLGGWFFTVFAFLLFANLSGLGGLRPPTADWSMAFALALVTLVLIHAMGIKFRGKKHFKDLLVPHWLFLPINIIGELARPVSLSFRLFGNMLAGVILIGLMYGVTPVFVRFIAPTVLHFYFDIFAGALQAYIFCILSLSFIGVAANTEFDS